MRLTPTAGVVKQEADGVDHRALQILNAADGLLKVGAGRVVLAVRDDQDGLFRAFGIFRHVVRGGDDRVIKRGAAL